MGFLASGALNTRGLPRPARLVSGLASKHPHQAPLYLARSLLLDLPPAHGPAVGTMRLLSPVFSPCA